MALQGGTDGFTGALSFLNEGAPESGRHRSHEVAQTLLDLQGANRLELHSRALALAFLERHDEAVLAYEDAITEMKRLGSDVARDSLAMLHFKHGSELARVGRYTQALASLEMAIALDSTWAAEAKEDETWAELWAHPRFKDLVGDIDLMRLRAQGSRQTTADGTSSSDCFYLYRGSNETR